ncbi:uncharacterized protein LOC131892320 [Tigriopus californicus]|uniref:uncharacterized protein LOC131892320 n=1 Tax=Tigriopus californicus TaxID=6832 RepID=UPI0027DA73E5|nr:uncharacterized protein LOC131892320 [Tigriopus californicus]
MTTFLGNVREEEEREVMEQKLEDETNRVLKSVALVQEHVEARAAEPSTIFGSKGRNLQQYREEERLRLQETRNANNRAVEIAKINLERAMDDERRSQAQLEELQLGSRVGDFDGEEMAPNEPQADGRMGRPLPIPGRSNVIPDDHLERQGRFVDREGYQPHWVEVYRVEQYVPSARP